MKKNLFLIILCIICTPLLAQWNNVTNGLTTPDRVGIRMSPSSSLHDYSLQVKDRSRIVGTTDPHLSITTYIGHEIGVPVYNLNLSVKRNSPFPTAGSSVVQEGDGQLRSNSRLHLSGRNGVSLNYSTDSYDHLSALYAGNNNGHVGINTLLPLAKLHVKNMEVEQSEDIPSKQSCGILIETNGWRNHDYAFEVRTGQIDEENNPEGRVFTVSNAGTVHIGKTLNREIPWRETTPYKLIVGGSILAERVRIEIASENGWGWADYVFEDDYKLRPINDLEEFIKAHRHLPGVPTTEEVAEDGIDVGEMNRVLLEKVEELTLYIIELEDRIETLEKS